jgi:drug/metabolite transporter (DMT)-like permease
MQKKHHYLLLLILGTAFWGISFTFVKVGVGQGSPFVFLSYKFTIAAFCLSLVFIRQLKYITLNTLRISVLIGIPLLAGTILQTIGLKYTTVSNSAFITGLDVLLIPLLKYLVYKKKVEKKIWLACIMALTGLYIIVVNGTMSLNIGDIWTIACAFGFAFYVLQVAKYSTEEQPMPAVILLMLFCAIGCFFFAIADSNTVWFPNTDGFWSGILFTAILATAYMYGVQNVGQRYLGEEKVALTYLFEPVFATAAGIILLNEKFTINIIIGGLLIISAMCIAEFNFKKSKVRTLS